MSCLGVKRVGSCVLTACLGVALALTTGCAGESATGADPTDVAELSGMVTTADYMHLRYADFDAFDEGIESGEWIPQSLRLYVEGEADGYVRDEDEIERMWRALSAIRYDADHMLSADEAAELEGPYISFSFDSGRSLIVYRFEGTGYVELADEETYPVEEPDQVQALVDELTPLAQASVPQPGEVVPEQNGVWRWDANGDGKLEDMSIEFVDNGDEAPCVLVVHLFGTASDEDEIVEDGLIDEAGYLEYGYRPLEVMLEEDGRGPYVVLTYVTGYFDMGDCTEENPSGYTEGPEERCTIRLIDGTLHVEPLDE